MEISRGKCSWRLVEESEAVVTRSSDVEAEVSGLLCTSRYVVHLEQYRCSCKRWQMTGLPCAHATSIISMIRGVKWEDYVSEYFRLERYKNAYRNVIAALPEKDQWERVDLPTVYRPNVVRQPGRPRQIRIRSKDEASPSSSQIHTKHKCKKCGVVVHRVSTCTSSATTRFGSVFGLIKRVGFGLG